MKRNSDTTKSTPRFAPVPPPEETVPNGELPALDVASGEAPSLKIIAPEKPKLEVVSSLPPDTADLSDLWLDAGLGDALTETTWHDVPIGKPRDFFRVVPDRAWRRRTEVYTHKVEGQIEEENFIVAASMRGKIDEARPALIVTCVYRDGSPRLWPLKFARSDEKDNDAWASARNAARAAMSGWVRLTWMRRAYKTRDAQPGYAPDPDWSQLPPFDQLVALAFGANGIIRDESHPAFRDLIGAAPKRPAGGDEDADDL